MVYRVLTALAVLSAVTATACASDAPSRIASAEPLTTGSILGPQTKLPVPRFVSLKSDRVNARIGPTRDHAVAFIYQRAGLPVEITAEFENWRRIRDHEGTETWVLHSLLSGRRTAMVSPRARSNEPIALLDRPGGQRIVARLEPRVQGMARACDGQWCRLTGEGFDGWIEQARLWGVYPGEKFN